MARTRPRSEGPLRLVLAVGALGAVALPPGCLFGPADCGPAPEVVQMPSGAFAPALATVDPQENAPEREFPHGVIGPIPADAVGDGGEGGGGAGGLGGEQTRAELSDGVPSARLEVDRAAGLVTRSYVNESGQEVVERYRIKGVR